MTIMMLERHMAASGPSDPLLTAFALLLFGGIVEPPDDDLTTGLPAKLFGGRLDLRGKEGQSGGPFYRFDWKRSRRD